MPLDGIPWWANALGGLISGGVIAKLIDATRERGKTLSGERISLREFEERLRASVLHENADLRSRLLSLEGRLMDLVENERKCDERNRDLESEIIVLRDKNDELRRDLDAITSALDAQSKRIISDSSVTQALDGQAPRHGS